MTETEVDRTDRHSSRLRWLVAAAVLLVVVIAGSWLVGFSSVFGVRTVTVSGEHRVSSNQILAAAAIPNGAALARLDTAAIQSRVSRIPAIRSVRVSTAFPSTVRITVSERVAVGYRPDGASAVLIDAQDVAFATEPKAPRLPQLPVSGDGAAMAAAASVAGSLTPAFREVVFRIAVPSTQTITLTLTDGRTVMWGGTDRSAEKAKLLPVLVHQPGQYFDVSDPSSVISRGA